MRMLSEHDYLRAEFDWIACDRCGQLAYLSSAGAGPVPERTLSDVPRLEEALEEMARLPVIGSAISVIEIFTPRDWIDAAERGLFAFDWSHNTKRYELVARPSVPLTLSSLLETKLGAAARAVCLSLQLGEQTFIPEDVALLWCSE